MMNSGIKEAHPAGIFGDEQQDGQSCRSGLDGAPPPPSYYSSNSTLANQALELARVGLAVFPLHPRSKKPLTEHGFKDATTDVGQVRSWWAATPDANIGIATGKMSGGLLVVDVDVDDAEGKDGRISLETWQKERGMLPTTLSATTGRGGLHLYYWCKQPLKNSVNAEKGIDIRADGGYVVAPPSIHENGNGYVWNEPFSLDTIAEADGNTLAFVDSLYEKKRRGGKRGVPGQVRCGERNDEAISLIGRMQQMGASDETIEAYASEFNRTRMEEPLGEDELRRTVESGLRYEKGPVFGAPGSPFKGVENLPRNEKEWSRVFARWLACKACYVPEEKGWRFWGGKHWVKDGNAQRINWLCKQFVDELIIYAQTSPGIAEDARQGFVSFVNKYNKLSDRKRLIEDTKCEVAVQRACFDAKANLLNLQNGTLDLDTLQFAEGHDPNDYCGKVANVKYDPDATCEEWEEFLAQALQGDRETVEFVQRVLGLCLTCDTSLECMFILLGPTRSGKSTVVDTMEELLNPDDDGYACSCNPESFAVKRYNDASRPSSDIARLNGRRLVVTSEPPKSMLFNAALLKQLTGRDMVTARFLNENDIQFRPQFKLVMTANNTPKVNDMTLFESDRIHVIPFDNHLKANQRDPKLKDRLITPESLSGILNWCIAGLASLRENGLKPSTMSVLATLNYKTESDRLSLFFSECTVYEEGHNEAAKDVFEAYAEWCRASGYESGGKRLFFNELRERGLLVETGTVNGRTVHNVVPDCRLIWGGVF